MSITHLTALRTILADAVDAHVNTGAGTAVLRIRDGSTALVNFDLSNPAFGNAVSGVITLADTPNAETAIADGEADNFQVINRNGDVSFSGSVSASGMGGDIEATNVNIANGQDVSLESFTYEAAP